MLLLPAKAKVIVKVMEPVNATNIIMDLLVTVSY